jgi:hypothetical protein
MRYTSSNSACCLARTFEKANSGGALIVCFTFGDITLSVVCFERKLVATLSGIADGEQSSTDLVAETGTRNNVVTECIWQAVGILSARLKLAPLQRERSSFQGLIIARPIDLCNVTLRVAGDSVAQSGRAFAAVLELAGIRYRGGRGTELFGSSQQLVGF